MPERPSKFGTVAVCIAALIVLAVISFWISGARSQGAQCNPHDVVVQGLKAKHNEERIFLALNAKGNQVEVFASATRTWTYVITSPDGVSCVVDHGDDIDAVRPPPPGEDS